MIEVSPDDRRFLLQEKYNGVETSEFFKDMNRLALGEPVAYVIGWTPFLECKIFLDSHPLIPRPETEYWTEKAIQEFTAIYRTATTLNVLDLFSGSGAIGIAVLKHVPKARVDFGEIDAGHFPTIEKNIRANAIAVERAHIIKTNVWSKILNRYNVILANPPYLSKKRVERIQESVLTYEPEEALFADNNGFALIEETLQGLPDHLENAGILYIEHEPEHAEDIQRLSQKFNMHAEVVSDQYGVARYSKVSFFQP